MQFTKAVGYGLRGMIYLASNDDKGSYVAEIADAEEIPNSFLAKIFQNLSKSGLVISQRGAKGGFVLARPPEEITARDIVQAIEGPLALYRCLQPGDLCDRREGCPVHHLLRKTQSKVSEVLASYTLKDMMEFG